jgi:hypothetical protein
MNLGLFCVHGEFSIQIDDLINKEYQGNLQFHFNQKADF